MYYDYKSVKILDERVREMIDLDILITSRVRRKIVVFFVTYPAIKMHVRGLAKLIKEDPGNIQRELHKLEKAGFLHSERNKNMVAYSANTDFLIFKELQLIVMKLRDQQSVSRSPRHLMKPPRDL